MFSRTTPPYQGADPEHDPLPLRLATAVVVLGLIATGVTVIWRDMAGHGGELMPLAASHGGLRQSAAAGAAGSAGAGQASAAQSPAAQSPAGRPAAGVATAAAGLRLLSEAAAACRAGALPGCPADGLAGPGRQLDLRGERVAPA